MRRHVLVAAVLCGLASAASAQSPFDHETTGELRDICASSEDTSQHFCVGFIVGAGQLYAEMLRAQVLRPFACPDPVPTLEQIRLTFVSWATVNQQYGDTRAIDGLMQAAAETWPCD